MTGVTASGEPVSERKRKRYALLNDRLIRDRVVAAAADLYGYQRPQVEIRLYVGRFAGRKTGEHEALIRRWANARRVGAGAIRVFGIEEVVRDVLKEAEKKQYRDNPVLASIKALREAGCDLELPKSIGSPSKGP